MGTCDRCAGLGYIEHEHGLIRLPCPVCRGHKVLPETAIDIPEKRGRPRKPVLLLSEKMGNGETLDELADKARAILKAEKSKGRNP